MLPIRLQTFAALAEHLKNQVWACVHDLENLWDEFQQNTLVKKVAHGIHKDHCRLLPAVGNGQRRLMLAGHKAVRIFRHSQPTEGAK
jgi:hypothetical protein